VSDCFTVTHDEQLARLCATRVEEIEKALYKDASKELIPGAPESLGRAGFPQVETVSLI
jgi:hypothetical protein